MRFTYLAFLTDRGPELSVSASDVLVLNVSRLKDGDDAIGG
jgi:hypothetical protein